MVITRRQFLGVTVGLAGAISVSRWSWAQDVKLKVRLSACDWSMGANGPGGMEMAKAAGLDGLEVTAGNGEDTLKIADAAYRQEYKDAVKKTGVAISSLAMGFLNGSPLASDARGVAWLEQTIDGAQDLGAKVILVAFFGKGDLRKGKELKAAEVDAVVEKVKAVASRAEKAGVILGLENTLSAKDNLGILDRVKSDAVQVYYDIRNSTDGGFDVPAEIKLLGNRMCQIHFKDGGNYLGEGKVDMKAVAGALQAINYDKWVVLETAMPSKDRDADFKRNAQFVRKLLGVG